MVHLEYHLVLLIQLLQQHMRPYHPGLQTYQVVQYPPLTMTHTVHTHTGLQVEKKMLHRLNYATTMPSKLKLMRCKQHMQRMRHKIRLSIHTQQLVLVFIPEIITII